MPVTEPITLGPGELTIGTTGSPIDVSCLINNAKIAADKDKADDTTKLCGTVVPGKTTYTFTLSGNIDTDVDDPAGFFALTQASPGSVQDFTFTPNTDAVTAAAGQLVIDPLDFGADEEGDPLTSDFEFSIVGVPTYTYPTP
jgi:hypothetical protein